MTAPVAVADNLHVAFAGGPLAVRGVSLEVAAGETLALVGESGSGKTTLARAFVGLSPITRGQALVLAQAVVPHGSAADRRVLAARAQMLFQDSHASLSPRMTIRRLLAEPLRFTGRDVARDWPDVAALMEAVGLGPELLDRYPHQLSGGQARRVALVRALVARPALLVADEPTAGLDSSVKADLVNLMLDLQARLGMAYLVVSHDLNAVRRIAARVAVMYLGGIVEAGPAARIFASPRHPYTAALLSANPRLDRAAADCPIVLPGDPPDPRAAPRGCAFHPRCSQATAQCRQAGPPMVDGAACWNPLGAKAVGTVETDS